MHTHRRRDDDYEHDGFNDEASPSGGGTEIEVRKRGTVSDKGKAVGTLLLGFGLGVGLAILFAPQSGEETREYLASKADEGKEYAQKKARELRERAEEMIERSKEIMARQKDAMTSAVSGAVEAGKDAYREKVKQ